MANDFTSTGCVALYRFESGALGTDSIGTNTLTNSNVSESTGDYKEGSCCADFEKDSSSKLYRTNANLSSSFPFKSTNTVKQGSFTLWFKLESIPSGNNGVLISKWGSGWSADSFIIGVNTSGILYCAISNASSGWESTNWTKVLSTGVWYHLGVLIDNATKKTEFRLWDDTAQEISTYSYTNTMAVEPGTGIFGIGYEDYWNYFHDGLIDEVAVFNRLISSDEIDSIRQGTYSVASIPVLGDLDADFPFITDFAGTDENRRGECNSVFSAPTFQANELYVGKSGSESINTFRAFTIQANGGMDHFGRAEMDFPSISMVGESNFSGTYGSYNTFIHAKLHGSGGASATSAFPVATMQAFGRFALEGDSETVFQSVQMTAVGFVETIVSGANTFRAASMSGSAHFSTVVGTLSHSFPVPHFRSIGGNKGRFNDYILQYSRW